MNNIFDFIYTILICALGGFIGQFIIKFFRLKIGMILAGGLAFVVAFSVMLIAVVLTYFLFGYPPLGGP
jgi:hypothetical protein